MAQPTETSFEAYGAIEVKSGDTITADNFPEEADIMRLGLGVRITDELGNETPLRGARVTLNPTGLTAPVTPLDNVPAVWIEGQTTAIFSDMSMKFHNKCTINFGKSVQT